MNRDSRIVAPAAILIVEDQHELRKLIRMTLLGLSCQLHEAANADEAIESLEALRPRIVILDIMMPGSVDGLTLCERIKARPELTATRVLLISARGQQHDIERGTEAGADAYLVKPFSPQALLAQVEAWLSQ